VFVPANDFFPVNILVYMFEIRFLENYYLSTAITYIIHVSVFCLHNPETKIYVF